MLTRYCPNCGTEVDETAVFCPTCGQPIDEAAETQIPPAPQWPEPPAGMEPPPREVRTEPEPPGPAAGADASQPPEPATAPFAAAGVARETPEPAPPSRWSEQPELPRGDGQPADRPAPAPQPPPRPDTEAVGEDRPKATPSVQVSAPVTLSGWLIGGGAALGALGALIGLFRGFVNPVEFLMLLALVGVALSVFAASSLPAFAHLRLVVMGVAFIGFGMALDRIGFGRANAGDLLFFLGTAAAGIGVVLVELGQDQPLGGPRT